MGYNTAILVLNDTLHEISENPASWWQSVCADINNFNTIGHHNSYVKGTGGGTKVFHVEHANYVTPYAIGGNYTFVIGNGESNTEQLFEINLLKNLAKKYDYRLVKRKEN